jgi:hypothetical protein
MSSPISFHPPQVRAKAVVLLPVPLSATIKTLRGGPRSETARQAA